MVWFLDATAEHWKINYWTLIALNWITMTPRAVSRVARVARDFGTPKLKDEDCELRPTPDLNAHWLKLKRLRVDDPKRYLATVFGNEKQNWVELCDSIFEP
ncbi:hypothetical protein E4U30_003671 [Claviceps sp. LM220 group G6]|nr:hypothetical protein E4U15_000201 [Claviceps sp. LM218 group G6]KAG6094058.1 hypothetical protein E4U30_003671 [Claviceps sp. LM220 group G6]